MLNRRMLLGGVTAKTAAFLIRPRLPPVLMSKLPWKEILSAGEA